MARCNRRDPVTAFSLADLVTYLPCDLMTKVDIASMAHGLECRQPFLDYRVVELAARMPRRLKFRRGRGKRILRETFRRSAAASRSSGGRRWASACRWTTGSATSCSDFAREVLLDRSTLERGYFRPEAVAATARRAPAGPLQPRLPALVAADLELWQREWIDG